MKSLTEAITENRIISLADGCSKSTALTQLASLLAPALNETTEALASAILERETSFNTALGEGLAMPHLRRNSTGAPLLAAIGWSQAGLDYAATDCQPVRLIVMFCIPDDRKNEYLQEAGALMRAVMTNGAMRNIAAAGDLDAVRAELIKW